MHKSVDAPPRRSRLGQWVIGLLLLLGGAALVWYYDIGQTEPAQQGEGAAAEVAGAAVAGAAVAAGGRTAACPCGPGRNPQHRGGTQGARHGHTSQHGRRAQPAGRRARPGVLHRRPTREGGSGPGRNRPASLPGGPGAGRGAAGGEPGPPGQRARRPAELPVALRAAAHPQAAAHDPGIAGQAGRGFGPVQRRAGQQREAPAVVHQGGGAHLRAARPPPGRRWQPRTQRRRQRHRRHHARCSRSRCCSPCPRSICPRSSTRCAPTTHRPSRPGTAPRRPSWRRARSARWTIRSTRPRERSASGRSSRTPTRSCSRTSSSTST